MKKHNELDNLPLQADLTQADGTPSDGAPLDDTANVDMTADGSACKTQKKRRFKTLRAASVCLLIFVVLCGFIYPLSVTLFAQTVFPYEANGSVIEVTLEDGTKRIFGSELIGQAYENPKYLFGRVNTGAPSNLSPESQEYKDLLNTRIAERKAKLAEVGYVENGDIPLELLSAGGSGVDPHISPETAYFQIPAVVAARNKDSIEKITEEQVREIVDKYTEGRFLWIFGEKRVNVLLVNLALDGLI